MTGRSGQGQVVSIDVGAIYDGWHGDGARTFICGGEAAGSAAAVALVRTTRLSLMAGIAAARPGNRIGDISAAVEDVAVAGGFGIVRGYGGHGIGTSMHESPHILNFRTRDDGHEAGRRATAWRSSRCSSWATRRPASWRTAGRS